MADADLTAASLVALAKVPNTLGARLGTGASTVGATAVGVDGAGADGVVIYPACAYGSICYSIMLSTDQATAVNVIIYKKNTVTNAITHKTVINIPASSGTNGVAPNVNAMAGTGITMIGLPIDTNNYYIICGANEEIKMASLAAMTANKTVFSSTEGLNLIA